MRDGVGAVGAMLYYPDDTMQHAVSSSEWEESPRTRIAALSSRRAGHYGRAALTQTMSAVTAACMVMRKTAFDAVGGFDETFAVAYNDVDLCLRLMSHGFRNVWTPFAELYHFESLSRGDDSEGANRARFLAESQG